MRTWSSTGMGAYCPCFKISVSRFPRSSWFLSYRPDLNQTAKRRQVHGIAQDPDAVFRKPFSWVLFARSIRHGRLKGRHLTPAECLDRKVRFQINLPVGDGDNIGGNIRGDVARLGFNNRKRGNGSASKVFIQFCGTLKETGVRIEDIPRVGLASLVGGEE